MPRNEEPLQLWGGLECTVNRVGDVYHDQLQRVGHLHRLSDLSLIADLGIRTLRYPLHWERFEATRSWTFFDEALAEMDRLGMNAIAGLVHHGSGPAHTNLLDPGFPEKLAQYAYEVAKRYPKLRDFTPVNEPNTTARFSTLYGHWYPHERSLSSYVRALTNQVKATVLSMAAIRRVNPGARLISTEDGGKTFSTPQLEREREFREDRRWLGTDLLCGRVTRGHRMFAFLVDNGLSEEEVLWFSENVCVPDLIGLNYYLTSDRFLDHRVEVYPRSFAGGDSGKEPLVDVEALRVRPEGLEGPGALLTEAWKRYHLPVALTEVHLGNAAADQIRWLADFWSEAQAARAAGVDVVAVTVWALLGSYDWCSLCTQCDNVYEPGVFAVEDATSPPVATELAGIVRQMTRGESLSHPALSEPRWWQDQGRLTFPPPGMETGETSRQVG